MIHFQNPYWLYLLLLLPFILLLQQYAMSRKKKTLKRFTGGIISGENAFQLRGYMIASVLLFFSLIFLITSITRPSWNRQTRMVERKGRDVVFLIDVSRSMLADDLIPNRLERAKLAVIDAVEALDGDRVALVAFAGSAVVKSPLTNDYSFFITAVEGLKVDSVSKGGSLIGDAIRYALETVLQNSTKAQKDIILITDGEDQESFPVEAASEADKERVRIIAIGLGDENQGKRIPVTTDRGIEFLSFEGKEVWTRLDAITLRKIAGATEGGQYLNVSTGTFDLEEIYRSLSRGQEETVFEEESVTIYEERFQFFLLLSFILLVIALFQPFRGWNHFISEKDRKAIRGIWKK